VTHGRKRWFVARPEVKLDWNPEVSTFKWFFNFVTGSAGSTPPHISICTQEVGEVLYLPDDWWHATLNVGDTVFFLDFVDAAPKKHRGFT